MATHTSSIDDLLAGGLNSVQPTPPEPAQELKTSEDEIPHTLETEGGYSDEQLGDDDTPPAAQEPPDDSLSGDENAESGSDEDEYGNKTEDLSESMRKRLQRQAESLRRKHELEIAALKAQLTPTQAQQVIQQAQDFEHDPNAEGDWQQQLAAFVKQTVKNMTVETQKEQQRAQQQAAEQQFRDRFQQGMDRFEDYVEVVSHQPVTDAMVTAARGMKDPAAFFYAAAKRAPQELERIAKISDPFTQMTETIRLEERLKKPKTQTNAPKPLARARDDAPAKPAKKADYDDSIESLIAASDAKRLALRNAKIRR